MSYNQPTNSIDPLQEIYQQFQELDSTTIDPKFAAIRGVLDQDISLTHKLYLALTIISELDPREIQNWIQEQVLTSLESRDLNLKIRKSEKIKTDQEQYKIETIFSTTSHQVYFDYIFQHLSIDPEQLDQLFTPEILNKIINKISSQEDLSFEEEFATHFITKISHPGASIDDVMMCNLLHSKYLINCAKDFSDMSLTGIDDQDIQELSANGVFVNCNTLYLSGNPISWKAVEELLKPANQGFQELIFCRTPIGNKGLQVIAESELNGLIKLLYLSDTNIDAKGMKLLANSSSLQNLEFLKLNYNNIGDEGVQSIARSTFNKLQGLYLVNSMIGSKGAVTLASSSSLQNLEFLNLNHNNIGDEGVQAIANSAFNKLQRLYLVSNMIGNAGAQFIAEVNFSNLHELDLSRNSIDAEGVMALSKGKFPNLKSLYLYGNNISYNAVEYLGESGALPEGAGIFYHRNDGYPYTYYVPMSSSITRT